MKKIVTIIAMLLVVNNLTYGLNLDANETELFIQNVKDLKKNFFNLSMRESIWAESMWCKLEGIDTHPNGTTIESSSEDLATLRDILKVENNTMFFLFALNDFGDVFLGDRYGHIDVERIPDKGNDCWRSISKMYTQLVFSITYSDLLKLPPQELDIELYQAIHILDKNVQYFSIYFTN